MSQGAAVQLAEAVDAHFYIPSGQPLGADPSRCTVHIAIKDDVAELRPVTSVDVQEAPSTKNVQETTIDDAIDFFSE
ncbi:hypothetical protein AGDE_14116 [Angomonas deanei]|uniref:Uncharacterized protein n=1 Tax=Angomonas deanei TaxID=59799 RepID=A0A7G2C6C7_9TRYP|nr:hypothetical protein AGDE_14116 [Angomonas deanei]CAD2213502.1 hypothetical protein, conserved [Angomonas deanei]|eukprot:EPY21401.1 hypothetical protein AGDE_14116 [Angomonas deanei]